MPSDLRDIGILAHVDAGKTSLTERILYVSGRIRQAGNIDDGTTLTDYLQVERDRGITVKAASAHLEWTRKYPASSLRNSSPVSINLIDTPGHVDFFSEVGRSLRALDAAVILVCGVAGVQARTEALYKACVQRRASRLFFINKMDRRGASFNRVLEEIRSSLSAKAYPIQLPWGEGEDSIGYVDLIELLAYRFPEAGAVSEVEASHSERGDPLALDCLPPSLQESARNARLALVEALASSQTAGDAESGTDSAAAASFEGDAELFEDFVAGRISNPDWLRQVLRSATMAGVLSPVLCGSAFYASSAEALLDAIVDFLPSPAEAFRQKAYVLPSGRETETAGLEAEGLSLGPDDSVSALVFKTSRDQHFGRLAWVRLRSGTLKLGDTLRDSASGRLLKVLKIFSIMADKLEAADSASDGDIVALALSADRPGRGSDPATEAKIAVSGSTLSAPDFPVFYEAALPSVPVVSLALEPRTAADGPRLRETAALLVEEDPSLSLREDSQTGRIELSGMGELQLEVAVERLAKDFGLSLRPGKPRVEYRERLRASSRGSEDFDRDLGGERARALVRLSLEPSAGEGFSFSVAEGLRFPRNLLEAARRGAESALSIGPAAGYPLEASAVSLEELSLPGLSLVSAGRLGERAVEIAANRAARLALEAAGSYVVEPVMRIEISVPDRFLGAVSAAINSRNGRIEAIEMGSEELRIVSAVAPLTTLFGFSGDLRSISEGRGECTIRFLRYERAQNAFAT